MPQYVVTVEYTSRREIKVFAKDEDQAKEKAADIVTGWKDVTEAEGIEAYVE